MTFTVEALIALLQRQNQKAELRSLAALMTKSGVEIAGQTAEGKDFRINSTSARPKARR